MYKLDGPDRSISIQQGIIKAKLASSCSHKQSTGKLEKKKKIIMGRAAPAAATDELKTSWPELVGFELLNAADRINIDRPDVSVAFYMIPTPLPTDYDPNRVVLVGDDRSVVVRTPVIG